MSSPSPALTARLRELIQRFREMQDYSQRCMSGISKNSREYHTRASEAMTFNVVISELDALLVTEGPTEHEHEETNAGLPRLHGPKVTRDA